MKIGTLFSMGVLTLMAGIAFAGLVQPAAVFVDEDNMSASGDQAAARFSDNDVESFGMIIKSVTTIISINAIIFFIVVNLSIYFAKKG